MATQELLGADIQMVLDVCPPLPSEPAVLREAVERTAAWAARARAARTRDRRPGPVRHRPGRHRRRTAAGVGGSAPWRWTSTATASAGCRWGRPGTRCSRRWTRRRRRLPGDQPRYLMGVGDPVSIVEAVALGGGHVRLRHAHPSGPPRDAADRPGAPERASGPSSPPATTRWTPTCPCATCTRYSRGYLRHLGSVGEPAAASLCTVHNLTWMLTLVGRIRSAIVAGTLDALRAEVASVWSATGPGPTPGGGAGPRS